MADPILRRPVPPVPPPPVVTAPIDDEFSRNYPMLWNYLNNTRWEDGSYRQTATLLFFVENAMLKACLNDRAGERSGFFAGASIDDLLMIIETKLLDDTVDWRVRRSVR